MRIPKLFSRIRPRIILTFGFLFIVLSIISTYIIINISRDNIREEVEQRIKTLARSNVSHVTTKLNEQKNTVELMARTSQAFVDYLNNPDQATNSEIFNEVQKKLSDIKSNSLDFQEIFLIDNSGLEVGSSKPEFVGSDKKSDPYFVNGIKETYIKDVYFSETAKEHSMAIATPVKDGGEVIGVLVVRVDFDKFFKSLIDNADTEGVDRIFAINSSGYLISKLDEFDNGEILLNKVDADPPNACVAEIAQNKSSYEPQIIVGRSFKNDTVIASYMPIKVTNWCIVVTEAESVALASTNYEIKLFIFLLIGAVLIFYFAGYFFSIGITKPLEDLKTSAEIIAGGDLKRDVIINSNDEVGQLSRSFDSMIKAIIASRSEVDKKVFEQTQEITEKAAYMENQQKAVLNILEDIDEERQNVSQERDKIDAILHSIGDGVFVVDENLKILIFNSVAEKLSGYSADEAIGKIYSEVLKFSFEDSGEVNNKFITEAIKTGKVREMANHTQLTDKTGKKIPVADSAAPIRNADGSIAGCVVVFRDVSKEREIANMKDEFLSIASHELRTPMTAIKGFLDMVIKEEVGKISTAKMKEYLELAYNGNERNIKLVNDLLNVSRIEAGRMKFDLSDIQMEKIIEQTIVDLSDISHTKSLYLKFEKPKKPLPVVVGAADKIQLVLTNLVSNALKFTEKGEVNIRTEADKKLVTVHVQDTGAGIAEEDQDKLFQKFSQIDTTISGSVKGTGLGLYISKMIVEKSGGRIWCESEGKGRGSTFSFSLPIKDTEASKEVVKTIQKEVHEHPDQK